MSGAAVVAGWAMVSIAGVASALLAAATGSRRVRWLYLGVSLASAAVAGLLVRGTR